MEANKKDALELLSLEKKIFNDCHFTPEEIMEIMVKEGNKIFVAVSNDAFVGFVSLLRVNTLHYSGMWVDLIGVEPAYQKRGIAKLLLEAAKSYADSEGVQILSGLIAKNNTASIKAFQNKGFNLQDKDYSLAIYEIS